jgi:localization factor PodJL
MATASDMAGGTGHSNGHDMSHKTPGDCAAHELKALMGDVIRQIGDADQRNTELLRQMQERLAALSVEARSARDRVPNEYLPGFDRIEDGMALLARRIAESYHQRQASAVATPHAPAVSTPAPAHSDQAEPYHGVASFVANHSQTDATHQGHQAQPAPSVGGQFGTFQFGGQSQPAHPSSPFTHALRSSVSGPSAQRTNKYGANVDTFDVIESVAGNSAEPWAPDQVDALTRLYDSSEPVFSPAPEPVYAAPIAPTPTHRAMHADAPTQPGVDRGWLEGRLADVSARVEQSLNAARPDTAFAAVERRFDELEDRLSVALSGVATKGDVSGLKVIEGQLHDLNKQVETALAELGRLDGIEIHMSSLLDQVSDDHLSELFERSIVAHVVPRKADRSEADYHAVAIAAAEAAASRVALAHRDVAAAVPRQDDRFERVDDVHSLLSGFIQERRQGDDYTAQVLEALQHGMVRLLDRVESMEADRDAAPLAAHGDFGLTTPVADDTFSPSLQAYPTARHDEQAPLAASPVMTGNGTKDRRADLQASAQRAALAQREKLKSQAPPAKEAPAGLGPQLSAAKKGGNAKANPQGSRRLMVSSLILAAVLAGGAGTVLMSRSQGNVLASPLAASNGDIGTKTATISPSRAPMTGIKTEGSAPVTVSDDIQRLGEVRETDRVPPLPEVKAAPERMSAPAAPVGILVQEASARTRNLPSEPAFPVATAAVAMAGDGAPGVASGQPRGALDLPPATVGPLSLRMAAAAGDGSAEFEVGTRLAEGKGTDQNFKEAIRWYQRSATQGVAQAQYRLGTLYERGLGVQADLARAKNWYQRAAEQGNVKAMHNLAVLAAGRVAASPDYETAAQWFTKASAYGLQDSQFNLAVLTESGLGLPRDPIQAAMWFILASKAGDKEAVRRRDALKTQMGPADYSAAEQLAKSWQPQMQDKLANDARFAGELWKSRQSAANPDNG